MKAPVAGHPRRRPNPRRCNRRFGRPSAVFPAEKSARTETWLGPLATPMGPVRRRLRFIIRSGCPGIACLAPEARLSCAAIPLLSSASVWKPKASRSEGAASTCPTTNLSFRAEELHVLPSRTKVEKTELASKKPIEEFGTVRRSRLDIPQLTGSSHSPCRRSPIIP